MKAVLAIVFAALLAAPLGAQIPTSSSEMRPNYNDDAYVKGALELKELSRCVIARRDGLANTALVSIPGSREEGMIIDKLMNVMINCMNSLRPAMRVGYAQLRGAVAEELYLEAHPAPMDYTSRDHSDKSLPAAWIDGQREGAELQEILWHDFAQCVVADAPAQADAILRTAPRSPEEGAAIKQIVPFLGPCIGAGSKFTMDAAMLRSYLAQALSRGVAMWPVAAGGAK